MQSGPLPDFEDELKRLHHSTELMTNLIIDYYGKGVFTFNDLLEVLAEWDEQVVMALDDALPSLLKISYNENWSDDTPLILTGVYESENGDMRLRSHFTVVAESDNKKDVYDALEDVQEYFPTVQVSQLLDAALNKSHKQLEFVVEVAAELAAHNDSLIGDYLADSSRDEKSIHIANALLSAIMRRSDAKEIINNTLDYLMRGMEGIEESEPEYEEYKRAYQWLMALVNPDV